MDNVIIEIGLCSYVIGLQLVSTDHSEKQKIEYLPPIISSPTSYAIVNKTLIMANEIAQKCQQGQIIVTNDLAIAKMAMKIQEKENPKFD